MAVQTNYSEMQDALRAGFIYDMAPNELLSRTVEDAALAFGKPVTQGTADSAVHPTTTGDTTILGISALDQSTLDDEFAIGSSARIITSGPVAVEAAATVAAGDPVHVVVATGTFTNAGGVQIVGATYESSGDSGDLVKVRLA